MNIYNLQKKAYVLLMSHAMRQKKITLISCNFHSHQHQQIQIHLSFLQYKKKRKWLFTILKLQLSRVVRSFFFFYKLYASYVKCHIQDNVLDHVFYCIIIIKYLKKNNDLGTSSIKCCGIINFQVPLQLNLSNIFSFLSGKFCRNKE